MIRNNITPTGAGRFVTVVAFLIVAALALASCNNNKSDSGTVRPVAFVSVQPQAWLAEQIGGNDLLVEVLVPPAQSPATYEPTPKQMAALEMADVYFRIGVPFESRFMSKLRAIIGDEKIVDLRRNTTPRFLSGHSHDAGDNADDHHGEVPDPHIWLDPQLVKIQARTVADELARLIPAAAGHFESRRQQLEARLDSVDAVVDSLLAPYRGRTIYVFHPSYGYFTDRYGLTQVAVEIDGKEPSARQLSDLITAARTDRINTLFVQPQYSTKTAATVAAAIEADLVTLDPLSRDYFDNLVDMARKIARSLITEQE